MSNINYLGNHQKTSFNNHIPRNNTLLIPQSQILNNQCNVQNPNLFGMSMIPVLNDSQISATQRIKQVESEVKRELEMSKGFDENELLKFIKKCDLHPNKLSDKCRKCKEVKKEISKIEEERKVLEDKRFCDNSDKKVVNNITESNCLNSNNYRNNAQLNNNIHTHWYQKQFKTHGDSITCNLNTLIHNNILSSQYFKEIFASKGYNEILDEIIMNAKYSEPWTVGTNGIPSTLYCCLYKLMVSHLSEGQVKHLLNYQDSPYIRCAGFLYIRYLCDPMDLWTWLSPYILDEQEFCPTANTKVKMTIGEYVEMLLKEYDHYGTRLPRIPVQIERELKMKLLMVPEKRQRKIENLKNISKFVYGTKCKAVSSQDNEWHYGTIIQLFGPKLVRLEFTEGDKQFLIGLEKTENNWFNHEMFMMKVSEYNKQFNDSNTFFAGEEIVDLGNIMIIDEDGEVSSVSYSSDKHKHNKIRSKDIKHRERSRSRKREKKNKHRLRSRESSPKFDKKEKGIYDKIIEQERNSAVARGKDYAIRPTSYKYSLSQALPTGNQRKRSKSPELKQKIEIINRKKSPEKEKNKEKRELSKEQKLKDQYGDSSGSHKTNSTNYYASQDKKKDILIPDIMKLGK